MKGKKKNSTGNKGVWFRWIVGIILAMTALASTIFVIFYGNNICERYTLPTWLEDTFCIWAEVTLPPSNINSDDISDTQSTSEMHLNSQVFNQITGLFQEFNGLISDGKEEQVYRNLFTERYKINWEYPVFEENWKNICIDPNNYNATDLSNDDSYWEIWVEIYQCDDENYQIVQELRVCVRGENEGYFIDEWIISIDYECPYP